MVDCRTSKNRRSSPKEPVSLQNLPYDLLLNIAQYLQLKDVDTLHKTCRSLHDFSTTRPVFRKLAHDLLRRCRALPLTGFQRLSDLSTDHLIHSVRKAAHFERAWRSRTPKPITTSHPDTSWYRVVSAPPNEEVDWLSPITSSYTLCATKSGKVVCWDVQRDVCIAEWNPGEKWELWKCRVEFEDRAVFFTMAKVISPSFDDDRVMEFILMRLHFPEPPSPLSPIPTPVFSLVTEFKTAGVVMNVFLLDPPARLLSAFVWLEKSTTVGLYALLDWAMDECVFIDTGIQCLPSSNWSCILHQDQIVIHSEEYDAAHQYFYPIDLLRQHTKRSPRTTVPVVSQRLPPAKTLKKEFIFPFIDTSDLDSSDSSAEVTSPPSVFTITLSANGHNVITPAHTDVNGTTNPFALPHWFPESAHFVRQWWPTLPGVPRLNCTVVLLASHDPDTHCTTFVLAQHYFRVPLTHASWSGAHANGDGADQEDSMMRLWYVSTPFEVVCVMDGLEEETEDGTTGDRPRPLVAVDFGHAVWIEYMEDAEDRAQQLTSGVERKCLRFVTFPTVGDEPPPAGARAMEGEVRTLSVPPELDLDNVETINIDQSQGAVILSVKEGKIFILYYE